MAQHLPPELIPISDGPSILLDKPILLLGRHQECDIQLNSRKVSRRHCCIAQVNDYLVVRDLESTNGIRINDEKVNEGELRPGDQLTVGNFQFRVRWPGHPEEVESECEDSGTDGTVKSDISGCSHPVIQQEDPEELSQFDSTDQPILLAEPFAPPPNSEDDLKHTLEDQGPSLILPENIDLAPSSSSDVFRKDS